MISHYRIDSRVVHGQTTTRITKEHPADGVLIVDDEIAQDAFMLEVYKSALGAGTRLLAFSVEKALKKLPEAAASKKNYIVIFKHTETARRMVEQGYVFTDTLNIGPQPNGDDARLIEKMLYLTPSQIEDLDALQEHGVQLIINPAFTTPNLSWNNAKQKAGVA